MKMRFFNEKAGFLKFLHALLLVGIFLSNGYIKGESTVSTSGDKIQDTDNLVEGALIWGQKDIPEGGKWRLELTDLIRFEGRWYCSFREGFVHGNHPSGRSRIIRSEDGRTWESAFVAEWQGADVRDMQLSVTAEGFLMANACLYFVSEEAVFAGKGGISRFDRPTPDGRSYGRFHQLRSPGTPAGDDERLVARQSVTWFSRNGTHWSSACCDASGVNNWLWRVKWFRGMGYSVAYAGKDQKGTLYRTRDGKSWRMMQGDIFPQSGNEAALEFSDDGTLYCLLRDARLRTEMPSDTGKHSPDDDGRRVESYGKSRVVGGAVPLLGVAQPPEYGEWKWLELTVDWQRNGEFKPCGEVFRAPFGGPKLLKLKDGRWIALGRVLGPGRSDGHITAFWLEPDEARLTLLAEFKGATYGGLAEHDGRLWVSHAGEHEPDCLGVFLSSIPITAQN